MTTEVAEDWLTTTVIEKCPEGQDIVRLLLRTCDERPLPAFEAGAHIEIALPNGLRRQYSLCNAPQGVATDHYEIAILLEAGGRGGSRSVHEEVAAGHTLRISPPRNFFPLAPTGPSLLIAGGIGLTPLMAMAESLAQNARPFDLHICTRTAGKAAFRERLGSRPYADRIHWHFDDGPAGQCFDIEALLASAADDCHLYVCGPQGFMDHVLAKGRGAGWPAGRLHYEYFAVAPAGGDADGDTAFELVLQRSGRTVSVAADTSAATALIEAGVEVALSCEQGICGSCLVPVLEGEPDHRDYFQSDEERAANTQFTPCCSRARGARLVLDL